MKLTIQLSQDNIEEAITQYIAKKDIAIANKEVEFAFVAGRKGTGTSATVIIGSDTPKQEELSLEVEVEEEPVDQAVEVEATQDAEPEVEEEEPIKRTVKSPFMAK